MVQIGLGVPVPLLTPVTAAWCFPFAAYYAFLQDRVCYQRIKNGKGLGDSSTDSSAEDQLFVSSRAQVNFIENVPLALIAATLAELNGANRYWLNATLASLFAFRIAHAEFGIRRPDARGLGRPVGFYGTQAVMVGVAGWAAWVVKEYLGF